MNFDDLTDDDLLAIRNMPKKAGLPMRQNLNDQRDYSVGIRAVNLQGNKKKLTLSRYNGSSHSHGNFRFVCHIHHTTTASQHNKKPESGNVIKGEYSDMNGALNTLIKEYNVHGIQENLL